MRLVSPPNPLEAVLSQSSARALRAGFIDYLKEAAEALAAMGASENPADHLEALRQAHNLKGSAGSFGFQFCVAVAHRLESLFAEASEMGVDPSSKMTPYLDWILRIAEEEAEPSPEDAPLALALLPTLAGDRARGEALVASPTRLVRTIAKTVLQPIGLRVLESGSSVDSLMSAAVHPPTLCVFSAIMDGLTGADAARALSAMRWTKSCRIALISSLDQTHSDLKDLPKSVRVLPMGDALADALREWALE